MATFTEHYDLIKPSTDDYYDVADFNENMDVIDTQMAQTEANVTDIGGKIGEPGDSGDDTLFGLLHPSKNQSGNDVYQYSKTAIKNGFKTGRYCRLGKNRMYRFTES